jgi:hypothetical protein
MEVTVQRLVVVGAENVLAAKFLVYRSSSGSAARRRSDQERVDAALR